MSAGSVVFFASTLWHGGGLNKSVERLAVSGHYSQPWARPQENQFLIVPPSIVPSLSPKLQSMIGYSVHPPFIGHVDGLHPLKTLKNSVLKDEI
jgi:ectoine hydroxylase-related dioxygenase (phytanoyl-CoA dioxygenase family)